MPTKPAGPKSLQASYGVPYHKHAPIGPMVTLADYRPDGSVTLHTASQNAQHLRRMIAKMLGSSEDKVVVRTYPGPGHFGRSNGGSAGTEDEAVLLSRELGKPVRVQWMRGDDMQWSTQSSAMVSDIAITLDDAGKIATYKAEHRGPPMQDDRLVGALLAGLPTIVSPSPDTTYGFQGALINVFDAWVYGTVANVQEQGFGTYQLGEKESPTAVGLRDHSMRTPIQFQQNFPREVAISEAAALAGADPIQFRHRPCRQPPVQGDPDPAARRKRLDHAAFARAQGQRQGQESGARAGRFDHAARPRLLGLRRACCGHARRPARSRLSGSRWSPTPASWSIRSSSSARSRPAA